MRKNMPAENGVCVTGGIHTKTYCIVFSIDRSASSFNRILCISTPHSHTFHNIFHLKIDQFNWGVPRALCQKLVFEAMNDKLWRIYCACSYDEIRQMYIHFTNCESVWCFFLFTCWITTWLKTNKIATKGHDLLITLYVSNNCINQ